ncbi:MAG: hypothetical protein IKX63_05750 [Muribaculaceae bacterium]|nr:hypothetical protein [Muribaculaceae bacterium]
MLTTLIASAQIGSGQWKIHPYFIGSDVSNCVDVSHSVFYLSSGSLFRYDKKTNINKPIDATGLINDENIKQIYYDYDMGDMFIVYDNCNIDIIKNDGSVVNVSAIKDVVLPKAVNSPTSTWIKEINDIAFGDGKAYVATSFGYIVIDETNFAVCEVRNYDLNVTSVVEVGEYKIMCLGGKYYYCKAADQVELARNHKQADNPAGNGRIIPINDNKFFLQTSSAFYQVAFSADSEGNLTFTTTQMPSEMQGEIPTTVQRTPSGFVASNFYHTEPGSYGVPYKVFADYYYTFDANGNNATKHSGAGLFTSHEAGNWWVLDSSGLFHIVNGHRGESVMPNGITISRRAYWTTYDPFQQRVFLCRTSENSVLDQWEEAYSEINTYDGSQWHNVTPSYEDNDFGSNFWIEVSPNEPDTYFFCFRKNAGVAKVQNNEIVTFYNKNNGPLSDRMMAIKFDSQGNLWIVQTQNPNVDVAAITPQNQQLSSVNASNFVTNDLGGACYTGSGGGTKRVCFDIGAGDTKVFSAGNFNSPLIVWNNNADLSLNQYKVFSSFVDQNNKQFSTYAWIYIKADNDGRIWIGTASGVISFDPQEAFNPDFRITRNIVTRNEGLEANEVLLEGTQVNCIGVDGLNRKWIGTNTNGVYLVSADGSEILKHFDKTNSPLPSDQIYSVCCNRATNSTFIVTSNCVLEYFDGITPSASDYSNVYAYPNPVQSSFTGYVTINGLMENSNVIITDAAGTKVASLTSTGGIAMWDACNTSGVPVKTGIYKVYASQGTPSTTGKPVAKIAVIK